jgi:Nucleotidyl transferase AbiEii toxin, Type IV TA system
MNLHKDLKEFVELLKALDVHFVIVGAFALAHHGYPRYTGDIDLFVENSAENAERILNALRQFGFADVGLTKEDFVAKDQVVQLGVAPNRIDILTFLSGVSFEEAWSSREWGEIGGLKVPFISRGMLKQNKLASGRPQDLADLERL